jgi:Mg2+ and Co2+ transporter CorA
MQIKDLDEYILEDIESAEHPSDFIKREGYAVLILRLPEIGNNISIKSIVFLIEKSCVYRYNREQSRFEELGSVANMQELIEVKIEKLISSIKEYHFKIDSLEEGLYSFSFESSFMDSWVSYKKDVSLISRLMFHAAIVVGLLNSYLKKELQESFDRHAFEDLHEEVNRVENLAKAAVEKLDYLYDFYRAKVDEKMNRNVYYLTLLSGIFLPLTLATGFFGMNTGGLPYTNDPAGTWKVVVLSIILELLFFVPFILMNRKKSKRV